MIQNKNQQLVLIFNILSQKSYLTNSPCQTFPLRRRLHNSLQNSHRKPHTFHIMSIITLLMCSAVSHLFYCDFYSTFIWPSLSSFSAGIKERSRLWRITTWRKKKAPELFTRHRTLELWVSCQEDFLMSGHLINQMFMRTSLFIENTHSPIR